MCRVAWRTAGSSVSTTSELLPEPETPVTAMNRPSGNFTETPLRLFARAPEMTMARELVVRRRLGTGMQSLPQR